MNRSGRAERGRPANSAVRRVLAVLLLLPLLGALAGPRAGGARVFEAAETGAWLRWHSGGFAGKKIVVWGNSTVSHADFFLSRLAEHARPGGELEGLRTEPPVANTEAAQQDRNGRIHALGDIVNYGNRGASLRMMIGRDGDVPYRIGQVIAARPDLLIVRGPLINDVRMGESDEAEAERLLGRMLDQVTAAMPQTAVLLLTENSLLASDWGSYGFVRPNQAAQRYTDTMRRAVLAMAGRYEQVRVFDLMAAEYGVDCPENSPLMHDQLHPNGAGQVREADLVAGLIGR